MWGRKQHSRKQQKMKHEAAIMLDSLGLPGKEGMAVNKGSKALIAPRGWGHRRVAGDGRKRGLELALILQASAPLRTGEFSGKWKIVCLLAMTLSNLESCDEKVNSLFIYLF